MELLCPSGVCIHLAEFQHHGALELADLLICQSCASIYLGEYGVKFRCCKVIGIELLHSVVAQAAALLLEIFVTYQQGLYYIVKAVDAYSAHIGKFVNVLAVSGGILNCHGHIGAPCGQYFDLESALTYLFVVLKRVNGVIGSAYCLYVVVQHQVAGAELGAGQFLVALVIDLLCGLRIQDLVYSKAGLEFQVSPVIERVTHAVGHGLGPFLELVPVGCVAGYVFLGYSVGAQCAPFVMVSAKPQLGYGTELVVTGYLLRVEVAVVVYDRQFLCMIMKQMLCGF